MQRNKVYSVTTISQVAKDLGVSEDYLHDISLGMDREDGVIWVFGLAEDAIMAFTDQGLEELRNLIEMDRKRWFNPTLLSTR